MSLQRLVKVCPCILARRNDAWHVLAFEHPTAGKQLVKGTVDPGESIEEAAVRELFEESGIESARTGDRVGTFEREVGAGPLEDGPLQLHEWHIVLMEVGHLPDGWTHRATGSPVEEGLDFRFFWQPLQGDWPGFHPAFERVAEMLRAHAASHAIRPLLLDLLEWIGANERPYDEVMETWRTSCPALPVWEEATDRGFIERHHQPGSAATVTVTRAGREYLTRHRA